MDDRTAAGISHRGLPGYRRWGMDGAVILLLGGLAGAVLIVAFALEAQWTVFLLVSLVGLAALLTTRDKEKFLLFAFFLTYCLDLDYHPIFVDPEATPVLPLYGIPISIYEIPLLALFLGWLARVTVDSREKVRFHPWISVPFLLIWVLAVVGVSQGVTPAVVRGAALWKIFEGWLVFLFLSNYLRGRSTLMFVTHVLLATIVVQAVLGFSQLVVGGKLGLQILGENTESFRIDPAGTSRISRVGGTFDANGLASYMGLLLPINLALLFAPTDRRFRMTRLLPLLLLGTALLVVTYARAAWVGFFIGGALVLYLCLARLTRRRITSFLLVIGFFVVIAISVVLLAQPVKRRLFEDDYGSARGRIPMMVVASNVIRHNPWLGIGVTNYTSVMSLYDTSREAISYTFPYPVHNEYLLVAAEVGLPALVLFVFLLLVVLARLSRAAFSRSDPLIPYVAIGLLGGLITWLIIIQVDYRYNLLSLRFWTLIGLSQAVIEHLKSRASAPSPSTESATAPDALPSPAP